jgi:hypothetical protein
MTPKEICEQLMKVCATDLDELEKATGKSRRVLVFLAMMCAKGEFDIRDEVKEALRRRSKEFQQFAKAAPGCSLRLNARGGWEVRRIDDGPQGPGWRYIELGSFLRRVGRSHAPSFIAQTIATFHKDSTRKDIFWESLANLIQQAYELQHRDAGKISDESLRKFVERKHGSVL